MRTSDRVGGSLLGAMACNMVIENGGKPWRYCEVEWLLEAFNVSILLRLTASLDVIKHKM